MENFKDQPVRISHRSKANLHYQSLIKIRNLSVKERLKNGLKYFGLCLLASILFIFIPVLHFILVPAAILIGIITFYLQFRCREYCLENLIQCPDCQKQIPLKQKPIQWPIHEVCGECRAQILIEK